MFLAIPRAECYVRGAFDPLSLPRQKTRSAFCSHGHQKDFPLDPLQIPQMHGMVGVMPNPDGSYALHSF
jgi:hypothetical protein